MIVHFLEGTTLTAKNYLQFSIKPLGVAAHQQQRNSFTNTDLVRPALQL